MFRTFKLGFRELSWSGLQTVTREVLMAHSDKTYVGMGPGLGPALTQCQSIGPI